MMRRPDWFESLTGFRETSYRETQAKLAVADRRLYSQVNGRSWAIGEFEMVALAELRRRAERLPHRRGRPILSIVQGDVRQLHALPEYAGAMFQVASQFNALEMIGPDVTPEDGVTRYALDHTQGPACALAAAPATIFRNYFAPVGDGLGQTRERQLDGLAGVGAALSTALSRPIADLLTMKNGYALCSESGLRTISTWLSKATAAEIDDVRGRLSIGLHRDVEVTTPSAHDGQRVAQAFCSALPVAYGNPAAENWRIFATLVLEAAYEATLLAAALQAANGGSNVVLLTLLGGGAFGNAQEWILAAIRSALEKVGDRDLDIRIVSYADPARQLVNFVDRVKSTL